MLSHKSSCYSSSVKLLLNSAYEKNFSNISSVSITSPSHLTKHNQTFVALLSIPCQSWRLIHMSLRKSSLPTNDPYLFILCQEHNCYRTKSLTSSWWPGFPHATPMATAKWWKIPGSCFEMFVPRYLVCQLVCFCETFFALQSLTH